MPTPAWRTVTVTSGEITYREAADDALKSSRKRFEGADARAVGIPADAGKGLGIFDTIHDAPDSRRFAEELKAATHRDYGHVLPAFVMKLNELRADLHGEVALRAHLQRRMDKQLAKLGLPPDAPNHVVRAAQAFAVLATAGTLAAEWGLFGPITATEVEEAVATCFRAYMKDRGAGHTTELTVLKELRNLIQTNPVRFPKVQSNGTLRGESVRDIAGYTKEIRKQSYFLLFPPTLDEILKVAPRAKIFDELRKRSLLLCNKGRNDYRVRIGQLTQFYAISSRILSLNDEGVVIEDEEEVEDEPKRTKTRKVDDDEVPNRAKPKRKRPADIDDDGEDDLKSGVLQ